MAVNTQIHFLFTDRVTILADSEKIFHQLQEGRSETYCGIDLSKNPIGDESIYLALRAKHSPCPACFPNPIQLPGRLDSAILAKGITPESIQKLIDDHPQSHSFCLY